MSAALLSLAAAATDPVPHPELGALWRLAEAGFKVAPLRVVPDAAEETFYRLNNLPARLSDLFCGLDLTDPDEDDLEERAPEAQQLLRAHFLLDEFVDLFYDGLADLPAQLRVRRLAASEVAGISSGVRAPPAGRVVTRGRPALLALKETWADDWSFSALRARTALQGSVALAAQPVLLVRPAQDDAGDAEAARASALLGRPVRLRHDPELGLTGVAFL
jgi:hypothetical protein